jgi:cytochrome bd-type quinol oxidase subunit 2
MDTNQKIETYRTKYFQFGKFLSKTSQISQKVFQSIFFGVNVKIDNNCNVLRGVYDRLYSDICIYQGSSMNLFFDYYSLVPVLCTLMAIVFGLGNFLVLKMKSGHQVWHRQWDL